jgi:hypothetical protein
MSNTLPSPKTYKISSVICFILCGICMFIGILSFVVGGFLFVIFGALFLWLGIHYRKKYKIWDRITDRQISDTEKQPAKKQPAKKQGLEYGLNYVYVNKNSKVYHDDLQCRSVKPDFDMITWDNAVAKGLTRCKFCHK